MKVIILGGDGMLGHQLFLSLQKNYNVRVTLRKGIESYQKYHLFNLSNSYFNVDVRRDENLIQFFDDFNPEVVINAIGVVKQSILAASAIPNLEINALLPHRLAALCKQYHSRLIHISTDCVFSGRKGYYSENDHSDAEDVYGKTKFLGEINASHAVTLRTSFIGLELARKTSLLEWFLAQKGEIKGYRRAIYSGLSTLEFSNLINLLISTQPQLTGIWHVASESISKYDMLISLMKLLKRKDISIIPDDDFVCDRSLNGRAFFAKTGYQVPDWNVMLEKLVEQINERESNIKKMQYEET